MLLAPEKDLLRDVDVWVRRYLRRRPEAVMDPACGPGVMLEPYARRGCRVAGSDLHPGMVAEARRRLKGRDAEVRPGDMRELAFRSGPFDLVVNLSSSVGHLRTDRDVVAHLHSVARHTRTGGIYLLGVTVFEPSDPDDELWVLYESEPTPLPSGGTAAVRYESLYRAPRRRRERIRVVVLASGVSGLPPAFTEEYTLRTFSARAVRRVVGACGAFELLAAHDMMLEGRPDTGLEPGSSDVTLVLRRR